MKFIILSVCLILLSNHVEAKIPKKIINVPELEIGVSVSDDVLADDYNPYKITITTEGKYRFNLYANHGDLDLYIENDENYIETCFNFKEKGKPGELCDFFLKPGTYKIEVSESESVDTKYSLRVDHLGPIDLVDLKPGIDYHFESEVDSNKILQASFKKKTLMKASLTNLSEKAVFRELDSEFGIRDLSSSKFNNQSQNFFFSNYDGIRNFQLFGADKKPISFDLKLELRPFQVIDYKKYVNDSVSAKDIKPYSFKIRDTGFYSIILKHKNRGQLSLRLYGDSSILHGMNTICTSLTIDIKCNMKLEAGSHNFIVFSDSEKDEHFGFQYNRIKSSGDFPINTEKHFKLQPNQFLLYDLNIVKEKVILDTVISEAKGEEVLVKIYDSKAKQLSTPKRLTELKKGRYYLIVNNRWNSDSEIKLELEEIF